MRGCQTQEPDQAIPEGARGTIVGTSAKTNPSPSSVKNVNVTPQANPGDRRSWLRPQKARANQMGELKKGG